MYKFRDLDELREHYIYYQGIYSKANPTGQEQLRQHIEKLKQQIKKLEQKENKT
jgi:predicted transcriptional regulator